MRGGVARETFEAAGHVHQFGEALVLFDGGAELRGFRERFFELDVQLGGYELGEAVHVAEGKVEGAAGVLNGGFGGEGAEGDDLGDVFAAVRAGDVINHLAAAAHAEVNINVGE